MLLMFQAYLLNFQDTVMLKKIPNFGFIPSLHFIFLSNPRSRFGIERHPYTKSRFVQIPCVCMYVCLTTPPKTLNVCIKIIPTNRVLRSLL